MLTLQFIKLNECAQLPVANGQDSLGLDLCSVAAHRLTSEASLVDTGLVLHPNSYDKVRMLQLSLRSGFALKNSVVMVNAPGIVEPSYSGFAGQGTLATEPRVYGIGLALAVLGRSDRYVSVRKGDRIAQMLVYSAEGLLLKPEQDFETEWADYGAVCSHSEWRDYYQGRGGFGSTGA